MRSTLGRVCFLAGDVEQVELVRREFVAGQRVASRLQLGAAASRGDDWIR